MFNKDSGEIAKYGMNRVLRVAADATGPDVIQLTEYQEITFVDATLGTASVYLPPVSQCAGKIFTVIASVHATNDITVYPFNGAGAADCTIWDGSASETSLVLDDLNAYVCLYSTGDRWIVLAMDLTAAS